MVASGFAPVVVAAFGVSTPYAYWGFGLVCALVEAISGKALHLHVTSLEQLREGFAQRAGGSVVFTSDFPDAELARFACASGIPVLVFSDDPGDTLQWVRSSRGITALEAGRLCSRMYCALAPPLTAERALVFAGRRDEDPAIVVAAIIEHLWPGRESWLAEATFEHLLEVGKLDRARTVERSQYEAPPAVETAAEQEALQTMRAAGESYRPLVNGVMPEEIEWPLALFTRPDNKPWSAPFDLTGPARALFWGPYMHLPAGEWTARVEFEVDDAMSGVEALTDVRVNETVIEKNFAMPAKGIFSYDLSFRVDDPHHAIEIRLFIKKSAIEGVFLPRSVRVRPGV